MSDSEEHTKRKQARLDYNGAHQFQSGHIVWFAVAGLVRRIYLFAPSGTTRAVLN